MLHLGLLYCRTVPVAHRAYVHVLLSLAIALEEELLHEQLHPSLVELQRLGRVGQIGAVNEILEDLNAIGVVVEQ